MKFPEKLRFIKVWYQRALVFYYRRRYGIDPNKVVFMSFQGRSYNDNPRYISERLHERRPGTEIVWLFRRNVMEHPPKNLPDYVRPVHVSSKAGLRELATARVWVDNFTKNNALRKSEGRQFYIQTWHGDRPIKKICYDEPKWSKKPYRIEEKCDRVLTGSRFGERMYRTAFRYQGEYITAGAPRNDCLVLNDYAEIQKIRASLGIDDDTGLLLYAPTYRENEGVIPKRAQMDLLSTLKCLENKTGKPWKCLFRAHYKSQGIDIASVKDRLIDVTAYGEMSDLLLAADMVLTDYSSCATDFVLRDQPALFFASDWDEYISTRQVYYDIHDAPFMLAESQEQLEALIQNLSREKILQNCADIRNYFGCTESGRATDAACDYIIEKLSDRAN